LFDLFDSCWNPWDSSFISFRIVFLFVRFLRISLFYLFKGIIVHLTSKELLLVNLPPFARFLCYLTTLNAFCVFVGLWYQLVPRVVFWQSQICSGAGSPGPYGLHTVRVGFVETVWVVYPAVWGLVYV
jgi:hypothetical protein